VAPSGSTGTSKTPSSKSSTIVTDGDFRRDTFTPTNLPGELKPDHRLRPTSSHSSSTTVRSAADNSVASTQENLNRFKPGMLTIKIYTGSNFKIPFPINYDKEVLTRLINSGKRNPEDTLLSKLNNLSVADDRLDPKDSSNVVPATVTIPPSIRKNSLIYFTMEFDKTIVSIEAETGTVASPTFNKISQFDVTKVRNELKFQVFLKLPSILLGSETAQQGNQDILISSKTIDLSFENINNPIRLKNHDAVVFDNEYPDFLESTNGDILMSIDYRPNENKHLTIDDFDLLKVIGKGSFGKVMQVRKKDSGKIYALKAIRKSHIVSRSEVTHTLAERTVLARVDNPFIVPLKFSFQSPEKLYLVLSFINGGELFYHLQREGKFELSRARFYTCELLSALECLHSLDVIYRDLKPENILLDYKGHIALCDFGLCKLNMKNQDKTSTFCGTPEYLAPELLLGHGYTKVVDWWTLGILLYEMLTGLPPYYDEDVNTMYRKILTNPLKFPENFDKDAKDLLIGLLSRDPKQRLGNNGAKEIMEHAFFKLIDWNKLNSKGYLPPFKPPVKDNFDTSNFDKEFTNEKPVDSVMNDYLSESVQKQFGGWTYVGTEHLGDSGR
jgi:serum/glucocorticoid-regulated kinase 2